MIELINSITPMIVVFITVLGGAIISKLDILTFLKVVITTITCFLTPIAGLLTLVLLIVTLDTIIGIYTSHKLNIPFQQDKFFNVAVKLFFYLGTIILAYVIDLYILGGVGMVFGIEFFVSKIMSVFWVYSEVKSIDESNVRLGNVSFKTRFKNMLEALKSLKKDITDITGK